MINQISWLLEKLITPSVLYDDRKVTFANAAFKKLLTKEQDLSQLDLMLWLSEIVKNKNDYQLLVTASNESTEITVTTEAYVKGTVRYWQINSMPVVQDSTDKCQLIFFNDVSAAHSTKAYWDLHLRVNQATMQLEKEISVRKETEETLKKAQEQLVQTEKMSSLGVLSSGIAHELNNPINFISSNIDPLESDIDSLLEILQLYQQIDLQTDLKELLEKISQLSTEIELPYTIEEIKILIKSIREGATRTAMIVKDLRSFSRSDEVAIKKVDLHQGLDTTLTLLTPRFKRRIEIIKDYAELPEVECYPGKINQVFMNILANAMDAIKDEGKIWIKTSKKDNEVVIRIKDSGIGMSEQVKSKIFEPFYTTKDVGAGTGLGLSISYGIIREHRGSIVVESLPEQGAEFIITLPIIQT